jgi:hypothetical protein
MEVKVRIDTALSNDDIRAQGLGSATGADRFYPNTLACRGCGGPVSDVLNQVWARRLADSTPVQDHDGSGAPSVYHRLNIIEPKDPRDADPEPRPINGPEGLSGRSGCGPKRRCIEYKGHGGGGSGPDLMREPM